MAQRTCVWPPVSGEDENCCCKRRGPGLAPRHPGLLSWKSVWSLVDQGSSARAVWSMHSTYQKEPKPGDTEIYVDASWSTLAKASVLDPENFSTTSTRMHLNNSRALPEATGQPHFIGLGTTGCNSSPNASSSSASPPVSSISVHVSMNHSTRNNPHRPH